MDVTSLLTDSHRRSSGSLSLANATGGPRTRLVALRMTGARPRLQTV